MATLSKRCFMTFRRVVDMLLVTVLSVTLLREPLTVVKALSVTLCLGGVTMVISSNM